MTCWPFFLFCFVAQAGDIEESSLRQLLTMRRVFVDRLTGGETAAQMRDILISSMQGAKLFILTENQERADAILRGAAEDLIFTEAHNSSDSLNAHANAGTGRSSSRSAVRHQRRRERIRSTPPSGVTKRSRRSGW